MTEQHEEQVVRMTTNDLILIQIKDLKETAREVKGEIREVRAELKDTRDELNKRMDRLENRLDKLESKLDSSSNHGQISTITTIGIALAVIYSVLK